MKAFLLTVALTVCAGSIFAQGGDLYPSSLPPDYRWEIGVNGGMSGFTRPLGPSNAYQGTRNGVVPDYSLRATYLLNAHWMLNLDIGNRQWKTYGDWQLNDNNGQALKSREVTFDVADKAINESVGINYVIPFYDNYGTYNKANLNFGVDVGLVTTVNDGSLSYSRYNAAPDSNYTYVSKYDYGFGIGYSYGIQMGFTYYIIPRLGVNIDLAMRYVKVGTNDTHYGSENSTFYLLYFPETVGLRWRF